jgi:CubicO group peptidase (beta-lactamase class C family)
MKTSSTRRDFLALAATAAAGFHLAHGRLNGASSVKSPGARAWAEEADRLIATQNRSGGLAAAAFLLRQGSFEFVRAYGKATVDTPFLIASPTKPMTVSAVMWLQQRKQLQLSEAVGKFLPQFKGDGRDAVSVKHLLTHTSGLPDMLPQNVELRRRHAPLSEFVAQTCRTKLLFRPGERVSYQSMGILLAAAIVEQISGQPLPAFLATNIFSPLRMANTSLGLGGRRIGDTALCQVPEGEHSDWDWNSEYWRNLGAPWGGAHSTVKDLATFAEAFVSTGSEPWDQSTRREMREIQTGTLRPSYGFGWVRESGAFGKTCSPATFGHHGSTGTVVWHDPASHVTCVLLTTKPASDSRASVIIPVCEIAGRVAGAEAP